MLAVTSGPNLVSELSCIPGRCGTLWALYTQTMSTGPATIPMLLQRGADEDVSLKGVDGVQLTYHELRAATSALAHDLNRFGIGRHDRVAIVYPNGMAFAVVFLGVTSCATAAPLNPKYTQSEFEYYLSDVRASALIVEDQPDSPAILAATNLGIQILRLSEILDAGTVKVALRSDKPRATAAKIRTASPEDTALVLHTSGTTANPKIVVLSHRNICSSASSIRSTLALKSTDVSLNIMPLFHIHGLVGSLLAPLAAGGTVVTTPGFDALRFLGWLHALEPTWYSAVPSMHLAILKRAQRNQPATTSTKLRFIRSSSAALPAKLLDELEQCFQVPVVEAYAMTEAAHQMTSNPLPPQRRKPGSVGLAAGPEVAIMEEGGERLLGPGSVGEVVVRGDSITSGYEQNSAANKSSFTRGWFRTGDQGFLARDGYLTLTGRLKEIINRGGEKVSPREVDDALLSHPAVEQAIAFPISDPVLGEAVAAAVVLRPGQSLTSRELQRHVRNGIAQFKVPRTIVFVDEIPKGPTGKLQRQGLAEVLGLT